MRPRKSARYRTKHAADVLVLAGQLVRGQGTPHATGQRAPTEKKRQADARILIKHTTHAIAPRSDPPLPRALRPLTPTERPLRTSGIIFGHIGGLRLAADTTRERHGPSARGSSRMSLCTLRARAMELISRGMEQNLRRSARATYLENVAYGPATHRVLSDGAEMADGRWARGTSSCVRSCHRRPNQRAVASNAPAGRPVDSVDSVSEKALSKLIKESRPRAG